MARSNRAFILGGEVVLINADCTVYEKDTFIRHFIPGIYWNDSRGRTVAKNGVQIADSVIVYIYSDEYIPKAGDIIVKGNVDYTFDASTQQAASASMRSFRESYPQYAVCKNVNDARYGGLPHTEVTAR